MLCLLSEGLRVQGGSKTHKGAYPSRSTLATIYLDFKQELWRNQLQLQRMKQLDGNMGRNLIKWANFL